VENLDEMIKKGLEKEYTYIEKIDLRPFQNNIDLVVEAEEILSNYKKIIKDMSIR
jgi:transposase